MSKITITPIGTCRINTPLRRGAARYPIKLNHNRIYGFIHTTEEARQQLEWLQGERSFDEAVLPILFRPNGYEELVKSVWTPSQLQIVEISSAKSYRVGDIAVQSNYLSRYFADFFASVPRARRFWSLASDSGRTGRGELAAFLRADPVFNLYDKRDRDLLMSISMRMQTFDDMLHDMGAIVERLGKDRVLFVTHVNATSPDGAVIPSRDKLIRWTRLAAQRLDVPCFDPTALMREVGQERAMERDGLDTTHFTPAFADRWYKHVHREYVVPRIIDAGLETEAGEQSNPLVLAESIATAIEFDDFFEASRQLFTALKDYPDNPTLCQLGGQVYGRIGDYPSVLRILQPLADSPDLTVPSLTTLMRAFYETGDTHNAVEIADRLLADEYETIEVYEIAGLAAEALGRSDDAARYGKLAFRLDQTQDRFATRVLDLYIASGETEKLQNWRGEIMDRLAASGNVALARALAEWAIARRDEALFRTAILQVAEGEIRSVERLVEEAIGCGMLLSAAEVIVAISAMPNIHSQTLRNFRSIAEKWADTCAELLAKGRISDAFALATACRTVLPTNRAARNIERDVLLHLRDGIRTAQVAGDHAAVVAMGDDAGRMLYRRYEIAASYAKSLLAVGRGHDALVIAREATAAFPDNIDLLALTAHIASTVGDLPTALELYGRLRQSADPAIERYRQRMVRFFDKAERTGPRLARTLATAGDFEEAIELCELLAAHTDAKERVAVELLKVRRGLRTRLRELDDEEDTGGEPMRILKLMLRIAPDDASTLRRLALESMKLQEFEDAVAYWRALDRVSPGIDNTAHNINRCQIFAQRKASRAGGTRTALAA